MFSQDTTADCVLRGKIENVRNLSQLLKCIHFKDVALCFASANGLKVVVEDSKCLQAAAFAGTDIFQEYNLHEELVSFKLDLNVLVECLTIFDSPTSSPAASTALNMYYRGPGAPLRLVLVEEDMVTDCAIKTLEATETLHFSIPGDAAVNKVIADGPHLRDIFNDLDPNSEYVDVTMSPDPPHFRLATLSTYGKVLFTVPKEAEMIEEFHCSEVSVNRYKYAQIKPALKPLQASMKVSLQMDEGGLLCFQFMVQTESKQLCYIEYFCTPVVYEED